MDRLAKGDDVLDLRVRLQGVRTGDDEAATLAHHVYQLFDMIAHLDGRRERKQILDVDGPMEAQVLPKLLFQAKRIHVLRQRLDRI